MLHFAEHCCRPASETAATHGKAGAATPGKAAAASILSQGWHCMPSNQAPRGADFLLLPGLDHNTVAAAWDMQWESALLNSCPKHDAHEAGCRHKRKHPKRRHKRKHHKRYACDMMRTEESILTRFLP
jgi:hypothetical protein